MWNNNRAPKVFYWVKRRTWRRPEPFVDCISPNICFWKLAFKLAMNLWVYRNWSRPSLSWKVILIKSHHSYIMIWSHWSKKIKIHRTIWLQAFLSSMSKCNSMLKSFTSAGRDFESTIKVNASTGEANDLTRFRHKAGWLHTFLSFLPRRANCSRQFTANGSIFAKKKPAAVCTEQKITSMKKDFIDILAPCSIRESAKKCSHNRAAKHIKISCLPREPSLR